MRCPNLVTKALAVIAARRRAGGESSRQRFVALVNSGFPETHQNSLALAICREFAEQTGLVWAGSLALGGGGIIGDQPLSNRGARAAIKHVIAALDLTAKALAEGLPVPVEAVG